jgi:hypothetical protein
VVKSAVQCALQQKMLAETLFPGRHTFLTSTRGSLTRTMFSLGITVDAGEEVRALLTAVKLQCSNLFLRQ